MRVSFFTKFVSCLASVALAAGLCPGTALAGEAQAPATPDNQGVQVLTLGDGAGQPPRRSLPRR
jgi:hypothetical protein